MDSPDIGRERQRERDRLVGNRTSLRTSCKPDKSKSHIAIQPTGDVIYSRQKAGMNPVGFTLGVLEEGNPTSSQEMLSF